MAGSGGQQLRWYQGLSSYHWLVLLIGTLSWMFDCMDQRIFVLSRTPAIKDLVGWDEAAAELRSQIEPEIRKEVAAAIASSNIEPAKEADKIELRIRERLNVFYGQWFQRKVESLGDLVTALMVIGWSVGGFLFGVYGDRLGRVKTLSLAILVYSVFTGLSGISVSLYDFCLYRFLMGCGIGGAFATAATLIAETMPAHARAAALGIFQALSALGNISGSAIARFIVSPDVNTNLFGLLSGNGVPGWRVLFMIGVLPALLVAVIIRYVREPDAWLEARRTAAESLDRQLGDLKSLFGTPRWRRNTFVGLSLAVIGVIGLWGVGFYSPELIGEALRNLSAEEQGKVKAMGTLLQDVGALLGMLAFTYVATRIGRRIAFAEAFVFCWVIVSGVFITLTKPWHAYVMLPVLGFATLSLFGGYSIYFPELYPARLRSTGTGFCYYVGRVLAALVILFKIPIREGFARAGFTEVFRAVSVALATVYLLGLIVLIWAPETKGKPLPTDEDA